MAKEYVLGDIEIVDGEPQIPNPEGRWYIENGKLIIESPDSGEMEIRDDVDYRENDVKGIRDLVAQSASLDGTEITEWSVSHNTVPRGQLQHTPYGSFTHAREKGTIALETDDAEAPTYDDDFPELRDRGLPWAITVPVDRLGADGWMTWEELIETHAYGAEISVHPNRIGDGDMIDEDNKENILERTLDYKAQLEENGIFVHRLVNTGTSDFEDRSDWENWGGRVLMGAFNSVGNVWTNWHGDSRSGHAGLAGGGFVDQRLHITTMDEQDVMDVIDRVALTKASCTLFWHPHTIGDDGYLTHPELMNIFDKVAEMRNNGDINVVTPTTSRYLYGDCRDNHLNPAPSFETDGENLITNGREVGSWDDGGQGAEIVSTDSRTGSQSLRLPPEVNVNYWIGLPGHSAHYVVEGYAKRDAESGNQDIRLGAGSEVSADYDNGPGSLIPGRQSQSIGTDWTHFSTVFGVHRDVTSGKVNIRNQSDTYDLHLDDVYIYPV